MKIATAAVLLMNIDSPPTATSSRPIATGREPRETPEMRWPMRETMPLSATASESTIMNSTVRTALSAKPAVASWSESWPLA